MTRITVSVQNTQTEALSLYMPLFDQLIHNALLKWSISEPSASGTLAECHCEHLNVTQAIVHSLQVMKTMEVTDKNICLNYCYECCLKIAFLHFKTVWQSS